MRAVKETKEVDESDVDLTPQCGKFPVPMSAVLYRVWLILIHPRDWVER